MLSTTQRLRDVLVGLMPLSLLCQVLRDLLRLFEVGIEPHGGSGLEVLFGASQVIFARSTDVVHDRVNVQGDVDEVVNAQLSQLPEALNAQTHVFELEVSPCLLAGVAGLGFWAELHSRVPGVS